MKNYFKFVIDETIKDFEEQFFSQLFNFDQKSSFKEESNEFILTIEVPGLTSEDVYIELLNRIITINIQNKKREYSIAKNVDTDRISATVKNGLLKIIFPKVINTIQETARKIEVK